MKLRRELGLWEVTLSGVGVIVGAGIYAVIGKVALLAGPAIWISFIIAAVLAIATGLSYAELSSMYPLAGAEFDFVAHALGKRFAFVVGWLVVMMGIFGSAAVSLAFAGYFSVLFPVNQKLVASLLVLILTPILMYGVKESADLGVLGTLIEVGGLLLIIALSIPFLGTINYVEMPHGLGGLLEAAGLAFFAYIGFGEVTKFAEETKEPEKNIPRAIVLAVLITALLYILVAIASVSLVPWEQLGRSDAPMALIAEKSLGAKGYWLLTIIALFATFNTVLLVLLPTSRILYGMARDGALPRVLAYVHEKRGTPWFSIILTSFLTIIGINFFDLKIAAEITDFSIFLVYVLVNLSLIILRFEKPKVRRPFKVPLSIGKVPIPSFLGVLFSLLLLLSLNPHAIIVGIITVVVGELLYLSIHAFRPG